MWCKREEKDLCKHDEVGSADDGSQGQLVGGQWYEMGGDERVVAL